MSIFLTALLVLAAIYVALVIILFFAAVWRVRWDGQREIKSFVRGFAKRYAPHIIEGQKWIFAREWERVTISSYDGLELVGYYLPVPGSKRTIILFHGFRSNATMDFACVYEYYNGLGLNILTVDQRSHGESAGRLIFYGAKERYDCRDWTQYVRNREGGDHDIFLGGLSMGCTTVLLASALGLPDNVRGIVADCGFTSAWDEFEQILKRRCVPVHPLVESVNFISKLFIGFDFRDCSTLDVMPYCTIPVLFVHGGADQLVPVWMGEKNYEACAAEKELLIVPEARHGASYLVDMPAYQKALKDFIGRNSVCGK